MYENEIEALESYRPKSRDPVTGAINAAIELMRAAQPKDEAAEAAYCERVAEQLGYLSGTALAEQRAVVRAECQIELACLRVDVADWKQRAEKAERDNDSWRRLAHLVELQAELASAQAEIEDWKQRAEKAFAEGAAAGKALNPHEMADDVGALEKQLSAAQAEIERCKDLCRARSNTQTMRDFEECVRDLAAAQAEIKKLTRELQDERRNHEEEISLNDALETKLADAQAELADQCAHTAKIADRCAELSTKLTNLRAAAERFLMSPRSEETVREFYAAIEESKK